MAASASVRAATVRDSSEVGRLIGVAFADDPVARWALGAPPQIEQTFRFLASHLYVPARSSTLIDGCGAAMWFAPGQHRAPTLLEQVMIAGKLAAGDAGFRHIRRTIQVDKATTSRRPEGCYYLFAIGVLPEARQRGVATYLLQHTLALADRDGPLCKKLAKNRVARYIHFDNFARPITGRRP